MYRIAKERKKEFSLSVHSYSPLWTSECVKKKRKPNFLSTDTTHIKWERETNRTSSHHILTAAEVEERERERQTEHHPTTYSPLLRSKSATSPSSVAAQHVCPSV